ncbi:WYL domain-containing protein [Actinotalea sp. BY-33]|uniref:WYL domain-containing protein n=1 Tax=Actinotalea soli TaxID=2819234 RepID=A0A939LQP4_9CELL|nr:WYL domain-containing protein [Actinotalea soli]MBO1752058.1 WYL domain-containing protein [Actinotalea soli]
MPTTSSRLLTLLSLLQARRDWPATVLADRLEVSDRTVRRDVDRLREMGYPVTSTRGREGGYRLEAGATLPPLLFDDEQAVALAVALRTAAGTGADVEEAATRALATVRQLLPARLRHRVDALDVRAVPGAAVADPVDPDVLTAVSAAIRAHEVLRFDYRSPGGQRAESRGPRRAEPHHLVTRAGHWYLVAWDLDVDDWRTFRLDRLDPRTPGGARFSRREVPGGDVVDFVTGRWRGATAPSTGPGAWPCEGEVILHAPLRDVVPYAYDGVVEDLGDGRCRVVLGAWSWVGLAATLGRFDVEIEVIGPAELTRAFGELAGRLARAAASAGGVG